MRSRTLSSERIVKIATGLAVIRAAIGAVALVAPSRTAKLIGFPPATDTAGARALARFFGLREIAMGVLTLVVVRRDPRNRPLMAWNAAVDGADAVVAALAIVSRGGIDRAALGTLALALPLCGTWLWLRTRA